MFIELFREISSVLRTPFIRATLLIGVLLVGSLSAQVYLHINQEEEIAEEVIEQVEVEPEETSEPEEVVVEMNVIAAEESWDWDPTTIEITTGSKVILHIDNQDDFTRGFAIDELDIDEPLPPLATTTVEFVVDLEPGEYEFYCSTWCGADSQDQKGTLVVLDTSDTEETSDTEDELEDS
ncbi:MAG: cupredoxin domain-containing protein [Candidatus Saccharimonadales bacterium]